MTGIRVRIPVWVAICIAALAASSKLMAMGIPAQRVIARLTIEAVPTPLQDFYSDRIDGIIERTIEPDGAWTREPRFRGRASWHYLIIDAAASENTATARKTAAESFPSKRSDARKLFRDLEIKHGGDLPWRLAELVDELQEAFEENDEDRIVQLTGYVIHFATDASNPFAATGDRDGSISGGPSFGIFPMTDTLFAHQNAAQRVGWELIRRNAERYASKIDAASLRFEMDTEDVAFDTIAWMSESLLVSGDLLTADRELCQKMGLSDGDTFLARSDAYYQQLDAACGEICVENLRRATRFAATLIVTAWTRAGSPDPEQLILAEGTVNENVTESQPPKPEPEKPVDREDTAAHAIGFVASRNSKVFHTTDCSHASRISEKNRLRFATLRDAMNSGKRPCRTCHPDQALSSASE